MRKPEFCLCENKGADQLRNNCEADQRLCFRYNSSSSLIRNFKLLAFFRDSTDRFASDLVENPEGRFSNIVQVIWTVSKRIGPNVHKKTIIVHLVY